MTSEISVFQNPQSLSEVEFTDVSSAQNTAQKTDLGCSLLEYAIFENMPTENLQALSAYKHFCQLDAFFGVNYTSRHT
jgi:hypothetical protein